jgi:hypothetical protein
MGIPGTPFALLTSNHQRKGNRSMHDLLNRTLTTIESWLTGQSSESIQTEGPSMLDAVYAKAVEYDQYIRSNVGGQDAR